MQVLTGGSAVLKTLSVVFSPPMHEVGGNLCIADGKPEGLGVMEHPSFKQVRGSKWLGWNLNSGLSNFKVHALYMTPPSLTIPT